MRRLFEWVRLRAACRLECIKPIGECAPARCQRVDLPLLVQDRLAELLQRAFEVGEFDFTDSMVDMLLASFIRFVALLFCSLNMPGFRFSPPLLLVFVVSSFTRIS